MELKEALTYKERFRTEKLNISQDYPRDILEERKRLQPMISFLNKAGKRATLRGDQAFIDGKKLSKQEIEEELQKYHTTTKRSRQESSPEHTLDDCKIINPPKFQVVESLGAPKSVKSKPSSTLPSTQNIDITGTPSSAKNNPSFALQSTPSRIFPVFEIPRPQSGSLTPIPGSSPNMGAFDYRSEK